SVRTRAAPPSSRDSGGGRVRTTASVAPDQAPAFAEPRFAGPAVRLRAAVDRSLVVAAEAGRTGGGPRHGPNAPSKMGRSALAPRVPKVLDGQRQTGLSLEGATRWSLAPVAGDREPDVVEPRRAG